MPDLEVSFFHSSNEVAAKDRAAKMILFLNVFTSRLAPIQQSVNRIPDETRLFLKIPIYFFAYNTGIKRCVARLFYAMRCARMPTLP